MNCSPPGSSIHGILQARTLEWVAISFSRGSSWPRDRTRVSHIVGRRFTVSATREVHDRSHNSCQSYIQIGSSTPLLPFTVTPFLKIYLAFRVLFAPRGAFIHHRRESLLMARSPQAVIHRLRCSRACGILTLRPGIELASAALQGRFVTAGPAGKSWALLPVCFPDFSNEFPVYKSSSDRKTQGSRIFPPGTTRLSVPHVWKQTCWLASVFRRRLLYGTVTPKCETRSLSTCSFSAPFAGDPVDRGFFLIISTTAETPLGDLRWCLKSGFRMTDGRLSTTKGLKVWWMRTAPCVIYMPCETCHYE